HDSAVRQDHRTPSRECKLGPVSSAVTAGDIPDGVRNWIAGEERDSDDRTWVDKLDPATGRLLCRLARSGAAEVASAVNAAAKTQPAWAAVPAVQRGMLMLDLVRVMQSRRDLLAEFVARETGKSQKDARGEVGGAIQLGLFFAGEGQRLY